MFNVEKTAPDMVQIEISGKLSADQMAQGLDALLPITKDMEDGKMLALYHDIEMPEMGAIFEEMKRLPQLFGVIGKVKKVAVLSDQKWIRDMAQLEGMVMPGTTIRGFEISDTTGANAFLADIDEDMDENFPV